MEFNFGNNYSLKDVLKLFSLKYTFSLLDLKKSYYKLVKSNIIQMLFKIMNK